MKTHEKCPGEKICTTDIIHGVIAQRKGETLASYCKPARCKLFYTKAGTTPKPLRGALEAASILRQDELINKPYDADTPAWEMECFKVYKRVINLVENKLNEELDKDGESASKVDEALKGDSMAFKFDLLPEERKTE